MAERLQNIFGMCFVESEKAPRTIDYVSRRGFGHDRIWRPQADGTRGSISGWCTPLPEVGDFVLMAHPCGRDTVRYRFTKVEPCWNPSDMYHGELELAPRTMEEKRADHERLGLL